MMNILDLVVPAVIFLIPLFAGALKGYSASKMIRIVADFVSPTISALAVVYFLDVTLINTGIVTESSSSSDIWYVCGLAVFGLLSWYGFFRLVRFGSRIANRNNAGLQSDIRHGLELSSLIIGPLLESFVQKLTTNINNMMQEKNDVVLDGMKDVDNTNIDLMVKCNTVLRLIKEQSQKIDEMSSRQSKTDSILEQVVQYFANVPHLYEILLSQIEAIRAQQENTPDVGDTAETVLTAEDGRANRIIGHRQQDDMAQTLRDTGFEITVGHGTGAPDYIIKDRNGTIVAVGSNKSYTLHNEPKRMQRRIPAKDCSPELILAKKLQIPMVLFVTNRINGRRWMSIIAPSELESWRGTSTSVMLAKDDNETGQLLEEGFSNGIVNLGGNA